VQEVTLTVNTLMFHLQVMVPLVWF